MGGQAPRIYERRLDYEFGGRGKRPGPMAGCTTVTWRCGRRRAALVDAELDASKWMSWSMCRRRPTSLACQEPLPVPACRTRIASGRGSRSPQSGMRWAVVWVSSTTACSLVSMSPATALVVAEQLPVSGLLRARGARLLLQAPERPGMAGPTHVRRRCGCFCLAFAPRDQNTFLRACYPCATRPAPTLGSSLTLAVAACTTRRPAMWPTMCF